MSTKRFGLVGCLLLPILILLLTSKAAEAKAREANCSFEKLSGENTQCWNTLFGEFINFKIIFSAEGINLGDRKGVLFTALGAAKNIPAGTLILPSLFPYEGDNRIENLYVRNNSYQYRVLYGLFTENIRSSGMNLNMFGALDLWQGPCDSNFGFRLEQKDLLRMSWVKNKKDLQVQLCYETPNDELYYFGFQTLLSKMPVQVAYKYGPAGEASGIFDHLLTLKNGDITPLFTSWHDKYGEPRGENKIRYKKDMIIEHSSLHTPFEGDTHYFSSLTAKRVYVWQGGRLVLTEESIAPLFVELSNGNDMIGEYNEKLDKMRKLQALFDSGKEKWRSDPIEVAKRKFEKCTNFRVVFMKEGVAVVWADYVSTDITRQISIHLYKPLYRMKDIGSRSIWSIAYDETGFSHDGLDRAMGLNPHVEVD